jgi:peptide/nickel transport system permease protein
MATRQERMKFTIRRFKNFLSLFFKSKRGALGVIILMVFLIVAIFAPYIAPHDPVNDWYVAGDFAKPEWYDKLFPNDPQSRNVILTKNPGFSLTSSIDFNVIYTSSLISTYYEPNFGKTEPGCIAIKYKRFGNPTGQTQTVKITKTFNYPYLKPLARFEVFAQFYIDGSTHVELVSATPEIYQPVLDVPVKISIMITRIENETAETKYDLQEDFLFPIRNIRVLPQNIITPTSYWMPADQSKLSSAYMTGNVNGQLIKPEQVIFSKPANYTFTVEITFIDTSSDKESVETIVYVDDLNFKGLGTAYGLLGTDKLGRDIFSQIIYGSRISLFVGLTATFLAVGIGLVLGMIAGYLGGFVDEILMRFTDALLVIPQLPLLLVLVAVMGQNIWNLIFVIGVLGWMGFARVVRSVILSLKERPFVEAAKAVGAGNVHIMLYHMLPNIMALVYVTLASSVPSAIVSEAALSWLGFFDPNVMSWGRMLHDVQEGLHIDKWWWVVPPGLLISIVALSFILIGHALDEILNPKLRQRR